MFDEMFKRDMAKGGGKRRCGARSGEAALGMGRGGQAASEAVGGREEEKDCRDDFCWDLSTGLQNFRRIGEEKRK